MRSIQNCIWIYVNFGWKRGVSRESQQLSLFQVFQSEEIFFCATGTVKGNQMFLLVAEPTERKRDK